jgi:thioredoxin reductase (NADPH)
VLLEKLSRDWYRCVPNSKVREIAKETSFGSRRHPLETSVPGVSAIGDARSGSVKRMSAAIGEGASVVRMVRDHLETGGRRL